MKSTIYSFIERRCKPICEKKNNANQQATLVGSSEMKDTFIKQLVKTNNV